MLLLSQLSRLLLHLLAPLSPRLPFCPFATHLCWLVRALAPVKHHRMASEMDGASEVMLRYSQLHARAAWRRFLMHQLTRPKYHG